MNELQPPPFISSNEFYTFKNSTRQLVNILQQPDEEACLLCKNIADYTINFRRSGASRENMMALIQFICVNIEHTTLQTCYSYTKITIVSIRKICN